MKHAVEAYSLNGTSTCTKLPGAALTGAIMFSATSFTMGNL